MAGYYVERQIIKKEETEEDVESKLKEMVDQYDLITSHERDSNETK